MCWNEHRDFPNPVLRTEEQIWAHLKKVQIDDIHRLTGKSSVTLLDTLSICTGGSSIASQHLFLLSLASDEAETATSL
jgi:hypothetical protein